MIIIMIVQYHVVLYNWQTHLKVISDPLEEILKWQET